MVEWTGEDWQRDIVARDSLDYFTLISKIANILYPELTYAAERERKLLEIPEMRQLKAICHKRFLEGNKLLQGVGPVLNASVGSLEGR